MVDLIRDLEAASWGGRELDYAIAKEIGWRFHGEKDFKEYGLFWRDATTDEWKQLPWWTTSLDAALTLVPEEWADDIWIKRHGGHHWFVELHIPSSEIGGRHKELPLALCIAALEARLQATSRAATTSGICSGKR